MASVTLIKLDRLSGETDAAYARRYARATVAKIEGDNRAAVPIRKHAVTSAADLRADIVKLEAEMTSFGANMKVDEAMALLAKRDSASAEAAGAILRSGPEVYEAYQARMAGERWQAPIAKAAEPAISGHALTIKKHLGTGDHEGLRQLFHAEPESYATYGQMMAAGLTDAYTEVAKRQQDRNPSDVSEAEKAGWKRKIMAWRASTTPEARKALAAAKASRDPAFQAAWIDLVAAGEIKALA
jgi:hypothetical protein